MKTAACVILALAFTALGTPAQALPQDEWIRIEGGTADFSIAVPSGFTVIDGEKRRLLSSADLGGPDSIKWMEIDELPTLLASNDGATFMVQGYQTKKLKDALVIFIQSRSKTPGTVPIQLNEFQGILTETDDKNYYKVDLVIGSGEYVYRIFGAARSKDNAALSFFLSSLKLNNVAPFLLKAPSKFKIGDTPQLLAELKGPKLKFDVVKDDDNAKSTDSTLGKTKNENGLDLVILDQPPAPYSSDNAYKWKIYDKVILRVTFGSGGEVDAIKVIRGLPMGLTESAVKTARRIRFLPAETGNKRVSTERSIQYNFSPWTGH